MEYRDQLKYIKSHQTTGGERRPERNRGKKPAKPSFLNRVLVFVQAVSAVVLFGSMAILGILPMKYMAGLLVLLVLLLLVVKRKQRCSGHSKASGTLYIGKAGDSIDRIKGIRDTSIKTGR